MILIRTFSTRGSPPIPTDYLLYAPDLQLGTTSLYVTGKADAVCSEARELFLVPDEGPDSATMVTQF